MFLETKKISTQHTRISKLGKEHTYFRNKTIVVICCDNCNETFDRELGSIDPRRLDNSYFHVCPNCDQKRFAQKKGVEHRCFWNLPADSDADISRF